MLSPQMPYRDRGAAVRSLQRDMACDSGLRRISEPTRYLQRPMLAPPQHFGRTYPHGYSHNSLQRSDMPPERGYAGEQWWYGSSRATSLPDHGEDRRSELRDHHYGGPHLDGSPTRPHRELQRSMPGTSVRFYDAHPDLYQSAVPLTEEVTLRKMTSVGDESRNIRRTRKASSHAILLGGSIKCEWAL